MSHGFPRTARRTRLPAPSVRGFSLIELIVVAAIILIVTAVVFTSNSSFSRTLMVTNTAYDIALSLRNAQTYGLGTRAASGISNAGYGVHFDKSTPARYLMFSDSYPLPVNKVGVAGICQAVPGSPQDASRPDAYAGNCAFDATNDPVVTVYSLGNSMQITKMCAYTSSWQCSDVAAGLTSLDVVFTRPNGTAAMTALVNGVPVTPTSACLTVGSPQGTERYLLLRASGQIIATAAACPDASGTPSGTTPSGATCSLVPATQVIPYGNSATLVWTGTNATSLNMDQGVGALTPPTSGSIRVSPTASIVYTGTVSGPGGSNTCSAAVNIQGTPYYQGASATGLAAPNGMAVAGNYAYVVDFTNNALVTFNISSPASPTMTSSVTTGLNQPWTLTVAGGYAYVTNYGGNSITVMDLSNPASPVRVNGTATGISSPFGATVAGNYLYVTNAGNNSLITYSLTNPAAPAQTSVVTTTLNAPRGITVAGGYAYVTDFNDSSLVTFSLATPATPVWTSKVTVDSGLSDPTDVKVANGYAYVSNYWSSSLSVLSLATPGTPSLVTNIRTNVYHPGGIAIANGFLYFAAGNSLLLTYSLANPAAPLQIGNTSMSSTGLGGIVSANNALYGLGSSIITFGIY